MSVILEAAELRTAVMFGLVSLDEVRAWADSLLEEMVVVNNDIIDISLSKNKNEAFQNLGKFSGELEFARIIRKLSVRVSNLDSISFQTALNITEWVERELWLYSKTPDDLLPLQDLYHVFDGVVGGWSADTEDTALKEFKLAFQNIANRQS